MGAFCGLVIPMSPGLSRSAFAQRERPSIDDLRKRMADTTDSTYRVGEIVEVYSLFDETWSTGTVERIVHSMVYVKRPGDRAARPTPPYHIRKVGAEEADPPVRGMPGGGGNAQEDIRYTPGQKVEAEFMGRWYPGEVISHDRFFVTVKTERFSLGYGVRPNEVRPIGNVGAGGADAGADGNTPAVKPTGLNVGADVRVLVDGRWQYATIVESLVEIAFHVELLESNRAHPRMVRTEDVQPLTGKPSYLVAGSDPEFKVARSEVGLIDTFHWRRGRSQQALPASPTVGKASRVTFKAPGSGATVNDMVVKPALNAAYVTLRQAGAEPVTYVQVIDIAGGQAKQVIEVSTDALLRDVSPDGNRLLFITNDGQMRVQVWQVGAPGGAVVPATAVVSFQPLINQELVDAAFADNRTLITTGDGGRTTGWDYESAAAKWIIDFEDAASITGNRAAVLVKGRPYVIDTRTGLPIVLAGFNWAAGGNDLAVSLDGRAIASIMPSQQSLVIQRITDDSWHGIHLPPGVSQASPQWLSSDLIMLADGHVVSLSRMGVVAHYTIPQGIATQLVAGRLWYATQTADRVVLDSVDLPHGELTETLQRDRLSRSALKPGQSVSVQINANSGANRRRAQARADAVLKKAGMTVAPGQEVTLKITVSEGPARTEQYKRSGKTVSVNIRPTAVKLEFIMQGSTVWQDSRSYNGPGPASLVERSKSLQTDIDEQRTMALSYLDKFELPPSLHRPLNEVNVTRSTLSAAGFE